MNEYTEKIQNNLKQVREKMTAAARSVGRDPDSIRLVVVTKGHSAVIVKYVVEAGVHTIGESYVKEAAFKIDLLGDYDIEWHMIGHIQSGKARHVAANFAYVHSLDRLELAQDLNKAAGEFSRHLPVLLECNVSGEETKHGWPAWDEERWPRLEEEIAPVMKMENLRVEGLMTMAPYHPDPENSRPYFQRLRRLRTYLTEAFPTHDLAELSMGMSGDYEVAIQEGATMIRIGTAIVGPRDR
ncbi:MAG: Pyridoxal phosphate homeostasis protein [Chloroflexi bacterium]|nr:Pyridoxal phosphate homeostasis protein [Chloroflexota bacterium]